MHYIYKLHLQLYLLLKGRLCIQTRLSTEMLKTATSVQLVIGGPPDATGRNSSPVTNMLWAPSTCSTL